jgi:hypothetical protein
LGSFFHSFFEDARVQTVLLLIALDLVLGVVAALKVGNFRLSFIADFLRNDVLGKVVPFAVLYAGYKYAGSVDIVIPGVDLEVVMDGAWVIVLAALVGSLLSSLRDLGLMPQQAPEEIVGPDPSTPVVPPAP